MQTETNEMGHPKDQETPWAAVQGQTAQAASRLDLSALVAGASGLVGQQVLADLLSDSHYGIVHTLVRRQTPRPYFACALVATPNCL
jgi:hypothetical protein